MILEENERQSRALQNQDDPMEDVCASCKNGICDSSTGDCVCFSGFAGGNCDSKYILF